MSKVFIFLSNLYFFNLHLSSMIFAVSKEEIQWSLDFGPDYVILTVKDVVQEKTLSVQKNLLPAWNLLLSQRQEILDSRIAQIPIAPNQKQTFEMKKEIFASAGAQDMDKWVYEPSDSEDIEFSREKPQVELNVDFRQGRDTPVSPAAFNHLEMGKRDLPKTSVCWMKKKTETTFLQQPQYLSNPLKLLRCSEVALLEDQ